MLRRASVGVGAVAVLCALAAPAPADDAPRVAILPFASAERSLVLYGKPVADAVAKRLRAGGVTAESISLAAALPARIDLVVDGRIVRGSRGRVSLEARVRDPARGTASAAVATRAAPLSAIDTLAGELATSLDATVAAAVAEQRRAAAADDAAARLAPRAPPAAPATPPAAAPAPAPPRADTRPAMIVFPAGGRVAEGDVAVPAVVTPEAYRLAERLGFRPVPASVAGAADGAAMAREVLRARAAAGAILEVVAVGFEWRGVLSARGRVRVVVLGADGAVRYDETVRTGTVLGSRGDRHDALVRFVAAQAVDIAAPAALRALHEEPRR